MSSRGDTFTSNTDSTANEAVNNDLPLATEAQESSVDQNDVYTGVDMTTYENTEGNNTDEVTNTYEGLNYNPYTSLTHTGRQAPISARTGNEVTPSEEAAYINYT